MAKTQEEILEEKLSQLTDDELMEYKAGLQEEQNIQAAPEPTTMEALSTGFVEGVPFMKDVMAGIDALSEEVSSDEGMSIDSLTKRYRDNMDQINDTINLSEAKAPGLNIAGNIAGGLALSPAIGAGYGSAAAYGAADALSRSEDRGVSDLAVGAAMGTAGQFLGNKVGGALGKAFSKTGKKMDDLADEALSQAIGGDRAFGSRQIAKQLSKTGQTEEQFVASIRKMGLVESGDSAKDILAKTVRTKDSLGKDISKFYTEIDSTYKPEIDITSVKDRLSDDILPSFLNSDDPGTREIGDSLKNYIDSIGFKETNIKKTIKDGVAETTSEIVEDGNWSLSRLDSLRKNINTRIQSIYKGKGADITAAKEQERLIAKSLRGYINEVVESLPPKEGGDVLIDQLKDLNVSYGNISAVKDTIEHRIAGTTADATSHLKISFRMLALASAGASLGGPVGAAAAIGLDKLIRDPKTPTYIANGLPKLAKHFTGDLSSPVARKLILASSMNNDAFKKTLESTIAEISLKEEPIPRNTEQSLSKSKDIEKLLKDKLPSLYDTYTELLEDNNQEGMAMFLDELSRNPKAAKFFQPGIGFDGKVYSPEDKATLAKQYKRTNPPGAMRVQVLNALEADGTIPDLNAQPVAPPVRHVPRTKKIHDY